MGSAWDVLLSCLTGLVGHRRCRLSKWNLLRRLGLRVALLWLGLLRPSISALRSFLLTLLDKFLLAFCLMASPAVLAAHLPPLSTLSVA